MRKTIRVFAYGLAAGALLMFALWMQVEFNWIDLFISDGCETTLCCKDCTAIGVGRIIDGDTLDGTRGRIRLYGIDTPEWGEPCFSEATERLVELAGETVRVEPGPRSHDGYERLLFYVYTESGNSIDEILMREGLAKAWTRDGQHRDLLVDLQLEAQRAGRGCLW